MFEENGMDELIKQLGELEELGKEIEKTALKEAGEYLQDEYKKNIYKKIGRDSGDAQRSITVSNVRKGQIHVGPTTDAFYLNFLENGFYNVRAKKFISATPIFQPMFLARRMQIVEKMAETIRRELDAL